MNENEVGAKHLVMIITNELFCNRYGYNRQGKKRNFLRYRINICAKAFPVMRLLLYNKMKKVILPRWKKDIIHKLTRVHGARADSLSIVNPVCPNGQRF
jgi:hypothetical protein